MTCLGQMNPKAEATPPPVSQETCSHTIIVPTKDRPGLLRRALASAQLELGETGEILVIDDHSEYPVEIRMERTRVLGLPPVQTGVAAARNAGMQAAKVDVIFFLDDDDCLAPGYCKHVLDQAAASSDYGFSAYNEIDVDHTATAGKIRFPDGPIPDAAPLRKRLCGFGMGFWIKRDVAHETGPVDVNLTINEDTDYVCKLIMAGKTAWYSASPGVHIHRHETGCTELNHLTARTAPAERARCMRTLCERYPSMLDHLGQSYIRHCLKTGSWADIGQFLKTVQPRRLKLRLATFVAMKTLGLALKTRLHHRGHTRPSRNTEQPTKGCPAKQP